ncbi:MAG: hypothetical protein ABWX69_09120 [Arthrobacter sp.]
MALTSASVSRASIRSRAADDTGERLAHHATPGGNYDEQEGAVQLREQAARFLAWVTEVLDPQQEVLLDGSQLAGEAAVRHTVFACVRSSGSCRALIFRHGLFASAGAGIVTCRVRRARHRKAQCTPTAAACHRCAK